MTPSFFQHHHLNLPRVLPCVAKLGLPSAHHLLFCWMSGETFEYTVKEQVVASLVEGPIQASQDFLFLMICRAYLTLS